MAISAAEVAVFDALKDEVQGDPSAATSRVLRALRLLPVDQRMEAMGMELVLDGWELKAYIDSGGSVWRDTDD